MHVGSGQCSGGKLRKGGWVATISDKGAGGGLPEATFEKKPEGSERKSHEGIWGESGNMEKALRWKPARRGPGIWSGWLRAEGGEGNRRRRQGGQYRHCTGLASTLSWGLSLGARASVACVSETEGWPADHHCAHLLRHRSTDFTASLAVWCGHVTKFMASEMWASDWWASYTPSRTVYKLHGRPSFSFPVMSVGC